MKNCNFIVFLSNVIVGIVAQDANFSCYVQEGPMTNKIANGTFQKCLSNYCIVFTTLCADYFSTTCYDETKPMSVINDFPAAKKYYRQGPESVTFAVCNTTNCNQNPKSKTFIQIQKNPSSFDHLLWPKIRKEKQHLELQNGITLWAGIDYNQTFKFVGQTFNDSKEIWFALSGNYGDGTYGRTTYIFNFVEKKFIEKYVSNTEYGMFSSSWENSIMPGQDMIITITNLLIDPVSNENRLKFNFKVSEINYNDIRYFDFITYGGDWISKEKERTVFRGELWRPFPMFYPQFPYEEIPYRQDIPKAQTKLVSSHFSSVLISKNQLNPGPNQKRNFEFRESGRKSPGRPGEQLVKIQILNSPINKNSTNKFHIFMWGRVIDKWYYGGMKIAENCTESSLAVYANMVAYWCDMEILHSIKFMGIGEKNATLHYNKNFRNVCAGDY